MKAVILAGGFGTRLRPLTYSVPKPLVPLVGRPLIVRMIESLPQSVDTVVLAVSYMKEALEEHFLSQPCGRKVVVVHEPSPLGTGGAIKNVAQHLDETFIAMNGDCISSLDLRSLVKVHREKGGIGTIALWQVDDPSAFGVVELDKACRIVNFQEKPKKEEARSDLINAGYYVFEPEILDYIGKGQVSIEREVFPNVLDYGLFGHRFVGHWMDCGTRESFLAAQAKILDLEPAASSPSCESCVIEPPNLIRSSSIRNARIGPYACIESGATVSEGCEVNNSLVMKGALLEPCCKVSGSIIGPKTVVAKDSVISNVILATKQ
jgi:mannose-1-phosphate guanylyltransferase